MQAMFADGRTEHVATAALKPSDPKLFTVEGAVLRPLADGQGKLLVEHAGHTREIPITVVSASSEPPLSFRLDVMPVFARAGCNMGSCHGAARGKDGFRLSLFGFDPAGDYHRITREFPGRRIDPGAPHESLLVQKA
ncbi:MAG: cell surface protein, partial [Planctomycetia bacterium]